MGSFPQWKTLSQTIFPPLCRASSFSFKGTGSTPIWQRFVLPQRVTVLLLIIPLPTKRLRGVLVKFSYA